MKQYVIAAFLAAVAAAPAHASGREVCMAKSVYGTHAPTTVWSNYELSRERAEKSAMQKCRTEATAKVNCRIVRCWTSQN